MRKRQQYQTQSPKSKIPTLIIMCVVLFVILYFGKSISQNAAVFFEPTVPVTDNPAATGNTVENTGNARIPSNASTIPAQANRAAAQKLLPILSKGSTP